jgi:hypothetical protein
MMFPKTWNLSSTKPKHVPFFSLAGCQHKDNLKYASWIGAREEITSIDDNGWSHHQRDCKVEMGTGT